MLNELPDPFSFYQLIGWISFCLFLISYQITDPKKTVMVWVPARLILAVHLYGLGSFIAACVTFFAAFRDCSSAFCSKKLAIRIIILHFFFACLLFPFSDQNIQDVLIVISTLLFGLAGYFRDHFWKQRLFALSGQLTWLVVFFILGSYAGFAANSINACSNIIGMIRYKLRASQTTS